jgi:hypothetical protein
MENSREIYEYLPLVRRTSICKFSAVQHIMKSHVMRKHEFCSVKIKPTSKYKLTIQSRNTPL